MKLERRREREESGRERDVEVKESIRAREGKHLRQERDRFLTQWYTSQGHLSQDGRMKIRISFAVTAAILSTSS
jgi:hypothetical protein